MSVIGAKHLLFVVPLIPIRGSCVVPGQVICVYKGSSNVWPGRAKGFYHSGTKLYLCASLSDTIGSTYGNKSHLVCLNKKRSGGRAVVMGASTQVQTISEAPY